jgi:hypothetical protein
MGNSNISWLEWQKLVIREEYKDIKIVLPARNKAQRQFDRTVRDTLPKVIRND